jgi:hypothetical protein
MMQWLTALQATGFATWVRESNSIWAYPTILTLHTVGLGILVGANWALDLRLLGVARSVPLGPMRQLFPVMWFGFWVNAITGLMLFAADAATKGATSIFVIKLGLVLVAVVVVQLTNRSVFGRDAEPVSIPPAARLLAVASLLLWAAAIATGRYMAYA